MRWRLEIFGYLSCDDDDPRQEDRLGNTAQQSYEVVSFIGRVSVVVVVVVCGVVKCGVCLRGVPPGVGGEEGGGPGQDHHLAKEDV